MTDRLRQISLRKFRDSVTELTEVVEVARRVEGGNIQILGFWTPYLTYPVFNRILTEDQPPVPGGTTAIRDGQYVREERAPGPSSPEPEPMVGIEVKVGQTGVLDIPIDDDPPPGPKPVHTPESAAAVARQLQHPVRAVPKPSQRKKP